MSATRLPVSPSEITYEQQQSFAEKLRRGTQPVNHRARVTEALLSLALLAAIAWMCSAQPPTRLSLLPAALCLAMYAIATNVRFETPFGFVPASQVAFVPLLFAMPVALAPPAVVLGTALSQLPRLHANKQPMWRLLRALPNSAFAFGPAAVFILSGVAPAHANGWVLAAALAAQFVGDFAACRLRNWSARTASLAQQLRETVVYVVDFALSTVGLLVAEELHGHPIVALAPLPLLGLLMLFAHERRARIESLLQLNETYQGTAMVLGEVVEADDSYTGEHCRMVVGLARAVGRELSLDSEQLRNLEFSALLHDVGKVSVPKRIINKPGTLTAEEWAIMQTHTVEGHRLLNRVGGHMREVGVIVRAHHERWDGGGYPDGLAGNTIPLEARIITCCDSWNAMRTDRVYRAKLSYEQSRQELINNSGTQFDPTVVEAFLRVIPTEADEIALADDAQSLGR